MTTNSPAGNSPVDRVVRPLYGEDELRNFLMAHGFRCAEYSLRSRENGCNWYAYRRSELEARRCECNDDKPEMQIIVKPSVLTLNGKQHRSAEVELCGESGGLWWNFMAYSMTPDEVPSKLDDVEAGLIAAWNALRPNARPV